MPKPNWRLSSSILIACLFLLSLLNWQKFPFFLDIYYHINVMRGFDTAGGIVNHAFWELAPAGNIHLYPPLFHLLLLIPYKMGLDILFIARLFSALSFVSLLATLSFVANRLFSPKTGFFVAVAAAIPFTFFLKLTITIPVTLSLIFILLAFYAFEENRKLACPMLIACAFYTHLGMPWLGLLAFILYGLARRDILMRVLKTVLFSLALSAPVIIHVLANIHGLENPLGVKVAENDLLEFYPLIYLFAATGLGRLADRQFRVRGLFFIALFLALLPLAINYRFRFLSGEGLLPVIFFAGAGLEKIYGMLERFLSGKNAGARLALFYSASLLIFINIFSPTISSYPDGEDGRKASALFLLDSTADNLIPSLKKHARPLEINLVDAEAKDWVRIIEKNTAPEDIICSNWVYIGAMLSATTGRPNAAQTFYEIKRPNIPINEFGSSKSAIWLREMDGNYDMAALKIASDKYKFRLIAETDKAKILLRDGTFKSVPVKPVVKTWAALSILCCAFLVILYDLARPRSKFSSLSRSSLE
ncbi:MAG: hypothetical protein WC317_05285 [Candidatus Omnitrophota bacterium]|jgi:hypothetical protein